MFIVYCIRRGAAFLMAISFCALPLELVFMVLFHGFGLIRVNIRFMVLGVG